MSPTTLTPALVPVLSPEMSFADASAVVVEHLKATIPLGYWSVTRFDGARQVVLEVRDDVYGIDAGTTCWWQDTLCISMISGQGPQIAPDAMAIPDYRSAPVAEMVPIGTYVGIPLRRADGQLFGTICGLDPQSSTDGLLAHQPLLELLASLLGMVLEADLARTRLERERALAERLAHTDPLTGLLNRRGWDRLVGIEDVRCRRFGDPAAVIVIDLDGLKEVNDRLGHAAGDEHLCRAARVLEQAVWASDVIARIGGDEFGILATDTGPLEASRLADRLASALFDAGLSASIGMAPYGMHGGLSAAIAAADARMYADKRRRHQAEAELRALLPA